MCAHSTDGFAYLANEYYSSLYRFAHSLTRNTTEASDLTQQTFLIWARSGHQLRERTKAKAWLFTTLYREHLRVRRRGTGLDAVVELMVIPAGSDANARGEQLDTQAVMAALRTLPYDYRTPLVLFYLQERSYREIAQTLRIPIGTVMTRLHRGRQRLRRAFDGERVACLSATHCHKPRAA